jgi:hypothetical protein
MIKNLLFAIALMSLALASGCAKGGNGVVPPQPTVTVTITSPSNVNPLAIYATQTLTLTATVTNASTTAVTWSVTGGGTLTPVSPATTPATATYVAPATAGSNPTITATLTADSTVTGKLALNVVDVTTDVAPATLSVGNNLVQQFTAIAFPDAAPQTFTWTCTAGGVPCKHFTPAPGVSSPGLAVYTAQDTCSGNCVQISAAAVSDPTACTTTPKNCTAAKVSLVTTRVNGTYAFQFSGFDGNNNATALAGTFTASNGVITGLEDRLTAGGWAQFAITGGSYTPTSSDPNNSNNAGTLTLPTGVFPNTFQVALDGAGDLEMVESDGQGTGAGIAQKSASSNLFTGVQNYVFGFTGVDAAGNRVGYAGLLPMDGSGNIGTGGLMDVNDNGNDTNICGAAPCNVTGHYQYNSVSGSGQMTLTSAVTMHFDFFLSSGTANGTNQNPLTFYAISTDPSANPAVSGTMVLQDSKTYNNAAFKGTSVSALSGAASIGASNASLTLGSTDGNGNFSGQFDQNNAGIILSAVQFPPSGANNYTYAASGTAGRYTLNMLGNPGANPVVAPLPFVLYASGANRGFLLDHSSSSVMTGTMNPQGKGGGIFGGSTLPGTYAAATTGSGNYGVRPIANNLLLTSPGPLAFNVSGTQYQFPGPGPQAVSGLYTLDLPGTGTVVLTAPSAQNYVIYVLDTLGCTNQTPVCEIQDFLMLDVDKTNADPSIIFAQQ